MFSLFQSQAHPIQMCVAILSSSLFLQSSHSYRGFTVNPQRWEQSVRDSQRGEKIETMCKNKLRGAEGKTKLFRRRKYSDFFDWSQFIKALRCPNQSIKPARCTSAEQTNSHYCFEDKCSLRAKELFEQPGTKPHISHMKTKYWPRCLRQSAFTVQVCA